MESFFQPRLAALGAADLRGRRSDVNAEEIIQKFAAKEAEFARRATTTPTGKA